MASAGTVVGTYDVRVRGLQDLQALERQIRANTLAQARQLQIQGRLGATAQQVVRAQRDLARASRESERAIRAKNREMQRSISHYGQMARAAAAVASVVGVSSIRAAAEYDRALKQTEARLRATAEQSERLERFTRELGRTTEHTATEAARGAAKLAAANLDYLEVLDALPVALDLATAGELDMAAAADILVSSMHAFDFAARDLPTLADQLAESSLKSRAGLREMGDALRYMSVTGSQFAFASHEVLAAIATVAEETGKYGQNVGRLMSSALLRLQNPSKEVRKELERLNITLHDQSGALKPLNELLLEFAPYMDDAASMAKLFAAENAAVMIALIRSQEEWRKTADEILNAEGAIGRIAAHIRSGLFGDWKKLLSQITDAAIGLGTALAPVVNAIVRINEDLFFMFADDQVTNLIKERADVLDRLRHITDALQIRPDHTELQWQYNKLLEREAEIRAEIAELRGAPSGGAGGGGAAGAGGGGAGGGADADRRAAEEFARAWSGALSTLGLATDETRAQFEMLRKVWDSLSESERALAMQEYVAALRSARDSGIELTAVERERLDVLEQTQIALQGIEIPDAFAEAPAIEPWLEYRMHVEASAAATIKVSDAALELNESHRRAAQATRDVSDAAKDASDAAKDANREFDLFGEILDVVGDEMGGVGGAAMRMAGKVHSALSRMGGKLGEFVRQWSWVASWFINIFSLGDAAPPRDPNLTSARYDWWRNRQQGETVRDVPISRGGGGGGRGQSPADIRRAELQAEQEVIEEQIRAWKEELRMKRQLLDENERLLERLLDDLEFYREGINDIITGTMTFEAFDRWIGRLEDLGHVTAKVADELRDLARTTLLDLPAMEAAAEYFGFDPLSLGPRYRQFKAATDIDEFSRHYRQLLLSGLNDSQIVDLLQLSHRNWEEELNTLVNNGRTVEEAIRELGGGSSLMRIENVFSEAAGWQVTLPGELRGIVAALGGIDDDIAEALGGLEWNPVVNVEQPDLTVKFDDDLKAAIEGLPGVQELTTALDPIGDGIEAKIAETERHLFMINASIGEIERYTRAAELKLGEIETAIEALDLSVTVNYNPPRTPPRTPPEDTSDDDGGLGDLDTMPPPEQPPAPPGRGRPDQPLDEPAPPSPTETDAMKNAAVAALQRWYRNSAGMNIWRGEALRLIAGTASYSGMYRGIRAGWPGGNRRVAGREPVRDPGIWPGHASYRSTGFHLPWVGAPKARYGGMLGRDQWTWVGEAGRELVRLSPNAGAKSAQVYPHEQSERMAGGGGGKAGRLSVHLTAPDVARLLAEQQVEVMPEVSDWMGVASE